MNKLLNLSYYCPLILMLLFGEEGLSQSRIELKNHYNISFQVLIESQEYYWPANINNIEGKILQHSASLPSSYVLSVQKIQKISSEISLDYGIGLREIKHTFYYNWVISSSDEWRDFILEKSFGSYLDFPVDLSARIKLTNRFFFSPKIGTSFSLLMFGHNELELKNDNYKYLLAPPGSSRKHLLMKPHFNMGLGFKLNKEKALLISLVLSNKTKYFKAEEMIDKYYLNLIPGFKITFIQDR